LSDAYQRHYPDETPPVHRDAIGPR
jgi:hypothetical protein